MTLGTPRFRGEGDVLAESGFDGGVVLGAVEGVGDGASAGVTHGAEESVAAGDLVFVDFEEVDAFEAELGGPLAELVDGELFVAPATDGLADAGLAGGGLRLLCGRGESRGEGRGGGGLQKCAAGRHDRVQGTASGVREPADGRQETERTILVL